MKNIKRVIAALAVTAMLLSTVAFATEKKTIDLNNITGDKEVQSRVTVVFVIDGKTKKVESNSDIGYPYLIPIDDMGKGGVTYIPIRSICNTLGVSVEWNKGGYAVLQTLNHGEVKLYQGATSITASDGTVYKEDTYTLSDGSLIPLCLMRNGRVYVPVRFLTNFI